MTTDDFARVQYNSSSTSSDEVMREDDEQEEKVPTTQLAKMSIDPKFVELTADVLKIIL